MLPAPPPDLKSSDYAAIEEAVMETARGRWFLMEFARRQRAAETQRLSDIADRLEDALGRSVRPAEPEPEPAAIAERLSDIAWSMRESGFDGVLCTEIDRQARLVRNLRLRLEESRAAASTLAAPGETERAPPQRALAPPPAARAEPPSPPFARIDALTLAERLAMFA